MKLNENNICKKLIHNSFRSLVKNKISLLIFTIGILSGSIQGQTISKKKPNVIVVITDDQGMGDLSCYGNPYIKTPNIDKFYTDAIRFTNYHVSTTCAPSRGAIMTGRHTNRLNVFHTISGRSILFEDEVTLPQIFAQNGYTNGMFGKWHLGDNYPYRPKDRGFHEVVRHGGGGIGQGPDYWGNDYFDDTYWHNGQTQKYDGYCTDVFFSEALNFIEDNKDRPFFCYIATNAPHGPLNVPKEYMDLYRGIDGLEENFQRFYGMITNIDDNFKLLQDKLNALNIADNTILIFTTDNGTAGGNKIFDAGLKGAKGSEYEGGHRVPLFIRWPDGKLTGGKDIDKLVAHYDLLPTFVELLDLDFNPIKPLDGKSLKPLLYQNAEQWPNRILYMDTQRLQNLVKYRKYSVMDDDWRLVNGSELYNMNLDRGQKKNVFNQHPEVVEKLALGYEKWWQSIIDEGVIERHAYIKAGSPKENPVRISTHDLMTGKFNGTWHQHAAAKALPATGRWKIEIVEDGDYKISLCRFPLESGLAINETFSAEKKRIELDATMPASTKSDFDKAYLYIADFEKTSKIEKSQKEVSFTAQISAGKYDMEAQLIDIDNRTHAAYYVYIEKL
ncbi:arylsulfatase [Aurantibacter crassamenti]|uniref:arylsulfatase n=1 Tax=Aurantibacter crassamenti TaxID=1837375 RepID=UPI001939F9E0|nr:arylsulfatase [Aurantibacter crassamenti]MBM1105010.1 arylsulfatase [Aurantibacter crassamenti]